MKVRFVAAVAPCAVPSEMRTLLTPGLVTVLNPVPEVPDVPEDPLVPDVPEEPLVPDVPEDPDVPDEPEVPEDPEVPDLPATNISTKIVLEVEVGVHPVPET